MVNVSDRTLASYIGGLGTNIDVANKIGDRTTVQGMTPKAVAQLQGAIEAAAAAGLAQIVVTAGKGGGHKSHSAGTEWDIKGVNPDGSRWTNEQRVAVARGAQAAGADRFGIYQMDRGLGQGTLHFGYSGPGRPAGFWGAYGLTNGNKSREFRHPAEVAFYKDSTGQSMSRAEARKAIEELGFSGASAVMQFQRAAGIPADGKIGPITRGAIRDALSQATRFADRRIPVPPADIPTQPALTPEGARAVYLDKNVLTPTVSASDLVRQAQGERGMPAPVTPVTSAPLGPAAPAQRSAADILASFGISPASVSPAAPDVVAQAAGGYDPLGSIRTPTPASIIADTRLGGVGSDPDRNVTSVFDPGNAGMMSAEMDAARVNSDLSNLRAGAAPIWNTGASLPAPSTSAVTMGANSIFDDGTVQSATPQPTFSYRTSSYDPLSSVQSSPAVTPPTPISAASFDDRWSAGQPASTPSQPAVTPAGIIAMFGSPSSPTSTGSTARPAETASYDPLGSISAPSAAQVIARTAAAPSNTASVPLPRERPAQAAPPIPTPRPSTAEPGMPVPTPRPDNTPVPRARPTEMSYSESPTDYAARATGAALAANDVIDTYNTRTNPVTAAGLIRAAAAPPPTSAARQTSFPGKEKDDYVGPSANIVFTQKPNPYMTGTDVEAPEQPKALPIPDAPMPRERPMPNDMARPGPLRREGGFANSGIKNKTAGGIVGAVLGAMAGSPVLGAALGKRLGSVADRFAPVYDVPDLQGMTDLGPGLANIQRIMSGSAPANSYAAARNVPQGYGVSWTNTGAGNSAQQHVTTPSGGGYTVSTIGPSLSPMQVTTYNQEQRRDSTSGGGGNMSAPSAGGVW